MTREVNQIKCFHSLIILKSSKYQPRVGHSDHLVGAPTLSHYRDSKLILPTLAPLFSVRVGQY